MELIRIVLVDLPPLLSDIVRQTVAGEPDLEVVGELQPGRGLPAALRELAADLAIVGADAPAGTGAAVLTASRAVRALEVDHDGHSVLHELRPHRMPLGEISSDALLSAIRAAPPAMRTAPRAAPDTAPGAAPDPSRESRSD